MRVLYQQMQHIFTHISPYPSLFYWFQMLARRIPSPEMIHPNEEVGLEIEEGV